MAYKATRDLVQRVMPLIEQLAETRIDKARLVQYLAASFGVDLGIMEIVADRETEKGRAITYRDKFNSAEHELIYPAVLEPHIEPLVLAEYKRLAVEKPLTKMDQGLFDYLFKTDYCDRCKYQSVEHTQIRNECYFAGHPINFEAK